MTGTPPENGTTDELGSEEQSDQLVGLPDQQVQGELDQLLNASIDVAQQLLDEEDGFMPFAVGLSTDGEVQLLMLEEDVTDGEEALATLLGAIKDNLEGIVGAAVVTDVLFEDDQDGVRIEIEHREPIASALTLMLPYRSTEAGYEYAELLGAETDRRFWV